MSKKKEKFVPVRSFDRFDEEAEREGAAMRFQGESGCLGRPPKGKTMRQHQDELKIVEVERCRVPNPSGTFRQTGI